MRQVKDPATTMLKGNTVTLRTVSEQDLEKLYEGTARGAWYNKGRYHDVEIYSILHDEVIRP